MTGTLDHIRSMKKAISKRLLFALSELEYVITQHLVKTGPVLSIANTKREKLSSGSLRIATSDNVWRDVVGELSQDASFTIIDCQTVSDGLIEEVKTHLDPNAGRCPSVLFLMRDSDGNLAKNSVDLESIADGLGTPFQPDPWFLDELDAGENLPAMVYRYNHGRLYRFGAPRKLDKKKYHKFLGDLLDRITA